VVFDCDGVLVDSERLSVQVEVGILADLGWELSPAEIVERFLGIADSDYVAQIEEHLGRRLPSGWLEEMAPRYREAFERELAPVPGVMAALAEFDRAGIPTCVASSGSHDKLALTLGLTGLAERFSGRTFSATEVGRGKPAPDLFLFAARRMGVAPTRCVVVEDSPAGVAAGRSAGMRTIAYLSGLVPAERLTGGRTDVELIDDMGQLAPRLLGQRGPGHDTEGAP
jgi:HAD superfamily hydrolase (TIGR01509 family)